VCESVDRSLLQQRGRYLIWRCRGVDNCGGLGDRLAGIVGVLGLALSIGRKFAIDWPELPCVFSMTHLINETNLFSHGPDGISDDADRDIVQAPVTNSSGHLSKVGVLS
jgi:hypothetical protein